MTDTTIKFTKNKRSDKYQRYQQNNYTQQWPLQASSYKRDFSIGKGNFGLIWRGTVHDQKYPCHGQKVAIKAINLDEYEKASKLQEDIRKEINIMAKCNHPNLLKYYCSFIAEKELWIVMPLFDCGSLRDITHFKYPQEKCIKDEVLLASILKQIVQGLQYFHEMGFIHRDLKAQNILMEDSGRVVIGDFGVSDSLKNGQKMLTFVGSPCWMAPEVMEQTNGYDHKADVWSLGITAIEIAEGLVPFQDMPSMKVLLMVLNQPSPSISKYYPWSAEFKAFVNDCLIKEPSKRISGEQILKKHKKFFDKAQPTSYLQENFLLDLPEFKERIPKPILEFGEKYWDLKYQKQAKKLGVQIGSVKDNTSDKSQQIKIIWQFSNDFTNDTTNEFNSDMSKVNQAPQQKEKSISPDRNRYMHTFGLEEDDQLPHLKKMKVIAIEQDLNNSQQLSAQQFQNSQRISQSIRQLQPQKPFQTDVQDSFILNKHLDQISINNVSLNDTFNNTNPVGIYSQQVLHTAPNQDVISMNTSSYSGSNLTKNFKNGLSKYNDNGTVVKKVMGNQSSSGSSALQKAQSYSNMGGRLGTGMSERNISKLSQESSNRIQSSLSSRNQGFGIPDPKFRVKSQNRTIQPQFNDQGARQYDQSRNMTFNQQNQFNQNSSSQKQFQSRLQQQQRPNGQLLQTLQPPPTTQQQQKGSLRHYLQKTVASPKNSLLAAAPTTHRAGDFSLGQKLNSSRTFGTDNSMKNFSLKSVQQNQVQNFQIKNEVDSEIGQDFYQFLSVPNKKINESSGSASSRILQPTKSKKVEDSDEPFDDIDDLDMDELEI